MQPYEPHIEVLLLPVTWHFKSCVCMACRFFNVEGCNLRIGVYESFDTLCIYLESDAQGGSLERNFWVKHRIAVVNQKQPLRTEWKESAICTKTWNNSVLQFMKVGYYSCLPSGALSVGCLQQQKSERRSQASHIL